MATTVYLLMGEGPCHVIDEGIPQTKEALKSDGRLEKFTFTCDDAARAFLLGVDVAQGWNEVLSISKGEYEALTKEKP